MSFADLAQHVMDSDRWLLHVLTGTRPGDAAGKSGLARPKNYVEYLHLLEELRDSGGRRKTTLESMTDEQVNGLIPDQSLGKVSVWWAVLANIGHEAHHGGQVSVYLRMIRR